MHPVIRILCFLIFCGFVAFGDLPTLLLASVIFVVPLVKPKLVNFLAYFQQLKRLKWFFLSILLVYAWLTPGHVIFPSFSVLSPSVEGLKLGFEHVFALMYIVFALHIFIKTIESDKLIAAILWCLQPLQWVGLPHKSLAIRISLILQVLDQVQIICVQPLQGVRANDPAIGGLQRLLRRMDTIADRITDIFAKVIQGAKAMPMQAITSHFNQPLPPSFQWLYPMILLLAFTALT